MSDFSVSSYPFLLLIPRALIRILLRTPWILVEWMDVHFPKKISSLNACFLKYLPVAQISVGCFLSHSFRFVLMSLKCTFLCFITLSWIVLCILDCFSTDMILTLSMLLLVITLDRSPCWSWDRTPVQSLPPSKAMKVGCVITHRFLTEFGHLDSVLSSAASWMISSSDLSVSGWLARRGTEI